MEFRQRGHGDDRRRRVLTEGVISAPGVSPRVGRRSPGGSSGNGGDEDAEHVGGPTRRYTEAALPERQIRVTDLIPCRVLTLAIWFVVGVLSVVALEAAYWSVAQQAGGAWDQSFDDIQDTQTAGGESFRRLASPGGSAGDGTALPRHELDPTSDAAKPGALRDARWAALDLSRRDAIAVWFRSATMAVAAALSLAVYLVRRHRTDDYRGRYRVWLWAAGCWMLLSVDATARLHAAAQAALVELTGVRGPGDGAWWALLPGVLLIVPVSIRVLLDMRESRLATATFALAWLAWAWAIAAACQGIALADATATVIFQSSLTLSGCLLLVGSMAFYARHVLLDAQGLVAAPKRRRRGKQAPSGEQSKDKDDATLTATDPSDAQAPIAVRISKDTTIHKAAAAVRTETTRSYSARSDLDSHVATLPLHREGESSNAPSRSAPIRSHSSPTNSAIVSLHRGDGDNDADSDDDDDAQGDIDAGSPSHKLSKAERKRLKKLRRAG